MKTKLCILTAFLSTGFYLFSQAPEIEWQKSFGGSGFDIAHSIQQTMDGGYIIAGYSGSTDGDVSGNQGMDDYWVVKLDAAGEIEWEKSLGGSGFDHAHSIQQTTDGGYIVAGESHSTDGDITGSHGASDYWIVKLNPTGDIDWQKSLGGSDWDVARSIWQTFDGGYIVAGDSKSIDGDVSNGEINGDVWVVKLNSVGDLEWEKSLGGSYGDFAHSIQQTTDGGYILVGDSQSLDGDVTGNQGLDDYWLVKLNSIGDIEWERSLGGSDVDYGKSVHQTLDGGYVVAGYSNSSDGDVTVQHGVFDYWVVKLDSSGNIEWEKSLGGSGFEVANCIQQTSDGGYIVAGGTVSTDGDITVSYGGADYWIVKLNPIGEIEWEKSLGGSGFDVAMSIKQTTDGGYIIAGHSDSTDGDITGNIGFSDYWIVKLEGEKLSLSEFNPQEIVIYPNPVKDVLFFKINNNGISSIAIYDNLGRIVMDYPTNTVNSISTMKLKPGIYMLDIQDDKGQVFRKKFIKK